MTDTKSLHQHGINPTKNVIWNAYPERLVEDSLSKGIGILSHGGALATKTGKYTGRSPNDRFIVEEEGHKDNISWGDVNKPKSPEVFEKLYQKVTHYLNEKDLYVQDVYAGASPEHRLNVRVVSESPLHSLFARNMFLRPTVGELDGFEPGFTVLHAPYLQADPSIDDTYSEAFVLISFERKMVLIGGTQYAGEIKKSIFSVMNYFLPAKGVMPMHCSANVGDDGSSAIFFGLSGTGKTTLSADGTRALIGDDEHGWSDSAVFNFEGGCYAKAIRLSPEQEPEIYSTTHRFGTILENVVVDPDTRKVDFDDGSLTENTRASYPIHFIPNIVKNGIGTTPKTIIMLTADAFGVLPPISALTPQQAMYHFLCGYTAKVAGTERGIKEPQAAFSACFGAPFMPRHPSVYAKLLGERIEKSGVKCWLVNTGWTGGAYGAGKRMSIHHTRAMVRAALDGRLDDVEKVADPHFGLFIPQSCPGIPEGVLNPRDAWTDKQAYDAGAQKLCKMFEEVFKEFESYVSDDVKKAGIYAK